MDVKQAFQFGVDWNYRTITIFIVLLALPNALGLVNIATPWGFKIHTFQVAVFLAAALFGPLGGALSGLVGSSYSAIAMHNPYLAVGNALLGMFTGLFVRKGWRMLPAVLVAYLIQMPWLIATDYYLVHLPVPVIQGIVIALLISDALWAAIAQYAVTPLRRALRPGA